MRTIEELIRILRDNPPILPTELGDSITICHPVKNLITKEEIIALHRHMWNWIADESEKENDYATKADYLKTFELETSSITKCHNCFACFYTLPEKSYWHNPPKHCRQCPFTWDDACDLTDTPPCCRNMSPYTKIEEGMGEGNYDELMTVSEYVQTARTIANLPAERPEMPKKIRETEYKHWTCDENDVYSLHFYPFYENERDGEDVILQFKQLANDPEIYEYASEKMNVEQDTITADSIDDAMEQFEEMIEEHLQEQINYYEELLDKFTTS